MKIVSKGAEMKKIALLALSFVFLAAGVANAAEQASGCVKCHTDETMLKSLFSPPKIAASSGGG